ncbi:MAG: hypothetical protein NVSMB52_18770 [Chloroflexota bacterium]
MLEYVFSYLYDGSHYLSSVNWKILQRNASYSPKVWKIFHLDFPDFDAMIIVEQMYYY